MGLRRQGRLPRQIHAQQPEQDQDGGSVDDHRHKALVDPGADVGGRLDADEQRRQLAEESETAGKQHDLDAVAENDLADVGDLFQCFFHCALLLTVPGSAASPSARPLP